MQGGGQLRGRRKDLGEEQALGGAVGVKALERGDDVLLDLGAEPLDVPDPLSLRAASPSSSRLLTPSSSKSRRAVFAPTPGILVTSTRLGGYFAFSFTAEGISPVSIRATIFSCSVLPTPGSSVARPARASSSTDTGLWRITRAASL